METGDMSDPTVSEFDKRSVLTEEEVKEPGHSGFLDPEVRKKAMERSLAVRRGEVVKTPPFVPSKNMLLILRIALDLDSGDSVRGWFAKAGIARSVWYTDWIKNPQFREWWDQAFAEGVKEYKTKWMMIGLKKMSKDFRYWNEVGKKMFGFIDKIAVKEEKSPEEQALYTELLELFHSYKGSKNHIPATAHIVDAETDVIEAELIEELKEGSE